MPFEDNFSRQAAVYAQYRPQYPSALFAYVATLTSEHRLAWDCGTGNGQAALGLTPYFAHIIATDASTSQITHASRHEQISYRVVAAEDIDIAPHAVDLVTVAQAVHWFDLDHFYAAVRRVTKPGGVIAVWCYHLSTIDDTIDAILATYYFDVVGAYWSPRVQLVNEHYQTLPFPFAEIPPPPMRGATHWTLAQLLGYLYSWSSTQRCMRERGDDPVAAIRDALAAAWGPPTCERWVTWPLYLRVGRV